MSRWIYFALSVLLLGILDTSLVLGKNQYDNTGNEKAYFDLDAWEPTQDIRDDFPYYLSGYDYQGRPVWIAELARWNYLKIISEGEAKLQEFEKYAEQFRFRLYNSPKYAPKLPDNSTVNSWVLVSNMEGYNVAQLSNFKALQLALGVMAKFEILCENMEYGYIVNTNFFANQFLNLMKPLLGNTMARTTVHGTTRSKWLTEIRKRIPRTSLPKSLGGTKSCSHVFGRLCE